MSLAANVEEAFMAALQQHVRLYGSVDATTLHLVRTPSGGTFDGVEQFPPDALRVMEARASGYGLRFCALPPPRKWCLLSDGPAPVASPRFGETPLSPDQYQPAPPVLLPAARPHFLFPDAYGQNFQAFPNYPYAPGPALQPQFSQPAPPPRSSTIYSGVVQLFGRTAALGSGKKYGFIRVDRAE